MAGLHLDLGRGHLRDMGGGDAMTAADSPAPVEPGGETPSLRSLHGIAPDLTGGVDAVTFVREQRDAPDPGGAETRVVDLARFGEPGVGIFAGRDQGRVVREACGIRDGDRVRLIAPDYVYALVAGFADELLRNTRIVAINGRTDLAERVVSDLVRRRVPFTYDPPERGTPLLVFAGDRDG